MTYFEPEFHKLTPEAARGETNHCSFIRDGKIQVGGISFAQAIKQRYLSDTQMTEEQKEIERRKIEAE